MQAPPSHPKRVAAELRHRAGGVDKGKEWEMTDKAMEEAQAIIEKHSSHIYNSLDLKAIIASALASKDAEIERLRELFKTLAEGVKVKALDDDQIMEVIKEVAPWKSEPQLNDLLTYEKSPPLFPQATYDVPSYRAERFVRAVERRILAALEPAAPEGQQEAVAHAYVVNGECEQIEWGTDVDLSDDPALVLLYTRPSEQAVTEAMVEAGARAIAQAWGENWECCCAERRGLDCDCGDAMTDERDGYNERLSREDCRMAARAALKAAMEAGR